MMAIVGGVAFFLYLAYNHQLGRQADERLQHLLSVDYPRIEAIRGFRADTEDFRQSLAAAIALQNPLLVEMGLESESDLQHSLQRLAENFDAPAERLARIRRLLKQYLELVRDLAPDLAYQSEDYPQFVRKAAATNGAFRDLQSELGDWEVNAYESYQQELQAINQRYSSAQQTASLFGLILIFGLFGLAWLATRRVLAAIQESDRLKESFLTTISHELRTPLNGVTGALNLLRKGSVSQEQEEILGIARFSAMELVKSVDEILTFSEFVAGAPVKRDHPFHLEETLLEIIRIVRNESAKRSLVFETDMSAVRGLVVEADRHKIVLVLRRLLENAVKFTPENGFVRFKAHVQEKPDPQGRQTFTLVVSDTGPGIRPELLEAVFTPFHQLDSSFTRRFGGLGMGLAISRQVSLCLDGSLAFETPDSGLGAKAVFRFPARVLQTEAPLPEAAAGQPGPQEVRPQAAENQTVTASARILLVEDNKVNQMIMSRLLRQLAADVDIAENGQEAVERVRQHTYDLVLMDCQMPVMDGYQATRAIRALPLPAGQVPIVAVTANAREEDRERCLESGMNAFVAKPVDLATLKKQLARHLSLS